MPGFDNGTCFFEAGVDPRGVTPIVNQMGTNGKLMIGSAASPYVVCNTLTAGTGIGITNGAGSITINSTGNGMTTVDVTGTTQTIAVNTRYIANPGGNTQVRFTLPATATIQDSFKITGKSGFWVIDQNANQQIVFGTLSSTVGVTGHLAAAEHTDCATLTCTTAGASTVWTIEGSQGNIIIN